MKDKGYFSRVLAQIHFSIDPLTWVIRMFFSPVMGRAPFSWDISALLLGRKEEGRQPILHLPFLNCLQLKIIDMLQWHLGG